MMVTLSRAWGIPCSFVRGGLRALVSAGARGVPHNPFQIDMSMRPLFGIVIGLTATLGACRVQPTAVPASADTGGFIVTLGRDTVSAESWLRSGNRVEGTFTRRVPRTVVVRYTMFLAP